MTGKPVFLTKQQREKLALERRQKEAEEKKAKEEMEKRKRMEFEQRALEMARGGTGLHGEDKHSNGGYGVGSRNDVSTDDPVNHISRQEIDALKASFFGTDKKMRKIRKVNERKVQFDWDETDDTAAADTNPLYAQRHEAQLYGRGHFGGIDIREQRSKQNFYDSIVQNRTTMADSETPARISKASYDDVHWTEKPLHAMRERDWRIMKEDFRITTRGGSIPHPLRSWSEAGLPDSVLHIIRDVGYTEPTPIQRQAIPIGLKNRDIVGIAETGSGKTASFVIPMLVFLQDLPPITPENAALGPYALILAPTRELALQIDQETRKFAERMHLKCLAIVGGHSIEQQSMQMLEGAHIIIATPGRLVDCLERRIFVLDQCTYVVMDEADKMIDMGFEIAVNQILESLPVSNMKPEGEEEPNMEVAGRRYRQTVMFSATMPPALERIARKYLRRPASVTIGSAGEAVGSVEQIVEMIHDDHKKNRCLLELLQDPKYPPPIIIFVNQKGAVDALAHVLRKEGYRCSTLHGGKNQVQREQALGNLKSGDVDVLVATDVAGRGIDVKDVSLVVNYDMAKSIEDYTHRIGRTGRAGKTGTAFTFLTHHDEEVMYDLKQMLERSSQHVPVELAKHEAAQVKPGTIRVKRKHEETLYK